MSKRRELKTKVIETAIATYCVEEGDQEALSDIGYDVAFTGEDACEVAENGEKKVHVIPVDDVWAAVRLIEQDGFAGEGGQVTRGDEEKAPASSDYTPTVSLTRVCAGMYDVLVDDIRTGDTLIRVGGELRLKGTFGTGACPGPGFCTLEEAILILSSEYAYDVIAVRALAAMDAAAKRIVPDAGGEEAAAFDAECDRLLAEDEEIAAPPETVPSVRNGIYLHLCNDDLMWEGKPRRRAPLYLRAA